MAEIVNLRLARKRRTRAEEESRAAENRARFGQSKGERSLQQAHADKERRDHDGRRLGPADGEP